MLQTLNFLPGGRIINAAATFFRYEEGRNDSGASVAVRVRADRNDLGVYYPGDSVELPKQVTDWEILPEDANCIGTVRLGVGRINSARNDALSNIGMKISPNIRQFSASSGSLLTVGVNPIQIVDPALNFRGAAVRRAVVSITANGGSAWIGMVAAPSTPPGAFPTGVPAFTMARALQSGTGSGTETMTNLNWVIPPGWGIWLVTENAVAPSGASGHLIYEVL